VQIQIFFPPHDTNTCSAIAGAGPWGRGQCHSLIFVFGLVRLSAARSYQPFPCLVGLSIAPPPRGKEAH
jgi:hypothetical protein